MKTLIAAVLFIAVLAVAFYYTIFLPATAITTTRTTQPMAKTTTIPPENNTIEWLEQRTFDLVNEERTKYGLNELEWNNEILDVCRLHGTDMAENDFFSHTGSDGSNVSGRLMSAGIYYWNFSGENILMTDGVDYYTLNLLRQVKEIKYKSFEELAQSAVVGWMNSSGHRENILAAWYDESAVGIYVLNESALNISYYFTQNFITRAVCGYKGGECCTTAGYLPWCYVPWKCVNGICA
jgi:uncharacterized protein YkwD